MLVKLSEGKNVCILGNEVRMVASLYGGVAQLVEQKTFNLLVGGSSPLTLTRNPHGWPERNRRMSTFARER